MNRHLRKALKRIESGVWKKCQEHFSDGRGNFCILGALTKAYDEMTGEDHYSNGGYYDYYDEIEEKLQPEVMRFYGLKDPRIKIPQGEGYCDKLIVTLNDETDMSLDELAQEIREHEKEVCIPVKKRVRKVSKTTLPAGAVPVPLFLPQPAKEKVL